MEEILIGTMDRTVLVFIPDPASTDGSGKTGLAHSALTVSYTRVETDNDVTISDVTASLNALTNLTDAHNDWGWKEVSSTLAPGLYRLDLADAVFASGAWYAVVYVMITSGEAAPSPKAFRLLDYTEIADALLKRDMSAVTGEASRSPINALRFLRNKWALSGTTLSVKKEDDATEAWSGTVSTDASAEPIVGNDPS